MDQTKKIILTALGMALIAFFIGGGTYAYFSDVEMAQNNNFTAGTLNLWVGQYDPCNESVTINPLKPGDSGITANWTLRNTGNIAGIFNVSMGAVTGDEGISTEPEGEMTNGSTVGLEDKLRVALWIDVDNDGVWESGDQYLDSAGNIRNYSAGDPDLPEAAYDALDTFGNRSWDDIKTADADSAFGYFRISYDLPPETGNEVQGDSCLFNITFRLKQPQP